MDILPCWEEGHCYFPVVQEVRRKVDVALEAGRVAMPLGAVRMQRNAAAQPGPVDHPRNTDRPVSRLKRCNQHLAVDGADLPGSHKRKWRVLGGLSMYSGDDDRIAVVVVVLDGDFVGEETLFGWVLVAAAFVHRMVYEGRSLAGGMVVSLALVRNQRVDEIVGLAGPYRKVLVLYAEVGSPVGTMVVGDIGLLLFIRLLK